MRIVLKSIYLIFLFWFSMAQSQTVFKYIKESEQIRKRDLRPLDSFFKNKFSSIEFQVLKWEYLVLKKGESDSVLHESIKMSTIKNTRDSLLKNIHFGKYYLFKNNMQKAHEHLLTGFDQAINLNDSLVICKTLYNLLLTRTRISKYRNKSKDYIQLYKKYAYNNVEKIYSNYFSFYFNNIITRSLEKDSIHYQIDLIKKSDCDFCLIQNYQRIAVAYNIYEEQLDSAIYYNKKVLDLINEKAKEPYDYLLQVKKGTLNNIARVYMKKQKYNVAEQYLENALKINSNKDRLVNDKIILKNISLANKKLGNFEEALSFYEKSVEKAEEFDEKKHSIEVSKLEEKYKNSELRRENLEIEKKSAERKNLIIILILTLTGVVGVLMLGYLAFKRKQGLLRQEKEFLLKEQELQSIDAMVEGQEKERQRIANELHDNLGGLLATLKLYVQNLKVKKRNLDEQHDLIIKNTDEVLEEAYQKVRSIAQTRNAGVLTSEGLIPTIQNYAAKVSASNSLIVEVADYGMEQRLNNSMEIIIFRIVQELITNVIKHANANEIAIDITNHKKSINLIVEDNGEGFVVEKIKPKAGMGLSSIKKRVEGLNGSLSIDSHIAKGTTIIIDIPLT